LNVGTENALLFSRRNDESDESTVARVASRKIFTSSQPLEGVVRIIRSSSSKGSRNVSVGGSRGISALRKNDLFAIVVLVQGEASSANSTIPFAVISISSSK